MNVVAPALRLLETGEKLHVHVDMGDQPGKHSASEHDVEVRGRDGENKAHEGSTQTWLG
jgi:hypothetical protein